MTGVLEQRRQDVPKSAIVIDEENPVFWGLGHRDSLARNPQSRSVMLTFG
jgi:hypothetical protein